MSNNPNRPRPSRPSKFRNPAARPDPATIEAARRELRQTRKEAASVVYGTEASWKAWELGDRPMHAGLWELFKIKTGDAHTLRRLGLRPSTEAASVATSAPADGETSSPDTP